MCQFEDDLALAEDTIVANPQNTKGAPTGECALCIGVRVRPYGAGLLTPHWYQNGQTVALFDVYLQTPAEGTVRSQVRPPRQSASPVHEQSPLAVQLLPALQSLATLATVQEAPLHDVSLKS